MSHVSTGSPNKRKTDILPTDTSIISFGSLMELIVVEWHNHALSGQAVWLGIRHLSIPFHDQPLIKWEYVGIS